MFILRHLPRFRFAWHGDAALLRDYISGHETYPTEEKQHTFIQQRQLLKYKVGLLINITQTFKTGQVMYDPVPNHPKNESQLGQDYPQLSAREYIIWTMKQRLNSEFNSDRKEVIKEVMQMFELGKGHPINRIVFSQMRFPFNEEGRLAFNPNPSLLSAQLTLLKWGHRKLFAGFFGIGKSISWVLLAQIYSTLALYNWISRGKDQQSGRDLPWQYKLVYITLGSAGSAEKATTLDNIQDAFRVQCPELVNEMPKLFQPNKEFRGQLSRVQMMYYKKRINIYIIVDQINSYYSDVRKLYEQACDQQVDIVLEREMQKFQENGKPHAKALFKKMNSRDQRSFIQASIKSCIQPFELKSIGQATEHGQREKRIHQILTLLGQCFTTLIYNSSKTIETCLEQFCKKNDFFRLNGHSKTPQIDYGYSEKARKVKGCFTTCKNIIFELKTVISFYKQEQGVAAFEEVETAIMKELLKIQWPVWVNYLAVRDVIQSMIPIEDQSQHFSSFWLANFTLAKDEGGKGEKWKPQEKSLIQWIVQHLVSRIKEYNFDEMKKKMMAFVKKGSVHEIYIKAEGMKNIYHQADKVRRRQFLERYLGAKIDQNKEDSMKFDQFCAQKPTFSIPKGKVIPRLLQDHFMTAYNIEKLTETDRQYLMKRELSEGSKQMDILCQAEIFSEDREGNLIVYCDHSSYRDIYNLIQKYFKENPEVECLI